MKSYKNIIRDYFKHFPTFKVKIHPGHIVPMNDVLYSIEVTLYGKQILEIIRLPRTLNLSFPHKNNNRIIQTPTSTYEIIRHLTPITSYH